MSDEFFNPADPTGANEGTPANTGETTPAPSMDDAFTEMAAALDSSVPDSDYVTLRHDAGAPLFAPLYDGETGITVKEACNRLGLRLGVVNAYVEGAVIPMDTVVPAGTIITLVGDVKGG